MVVFIGITSPFSEEVSITFVTESVFESTGYDGELRGFCLIFKSMALRYDDHIARKGETENTHIILECKIFFKRLFERLKQVWGIK